MRWLVLGWGAWLGWCPENARLLPCQVPGESEVWREKAGPARRRDDRVRHAPSLPTLAINSQLAIRGRFTWHVSGAAHVLMSGGGPILAPDRAPFAPWPRGGGRSPPNAIPRAESGHSSGRAGGGGWLDAAPAVGVACIKTWRASANRSRLRGSAVGRCVCPAAGESSTRASAGGAGYIGHLVHSALGDELRHAEATGWPVPPWRPPGSWDERSLPRHWDD